MNTLNDITQAFVARSREILGDSLVGVYLHGSAAMGCFHPDRSDIDLIVVVNRAVPDAVKRAFMDMVVALNPLAPKKGIELSLCRREVLKPLVYPTPFELHFSAMHLAWYARDPEDYIYRMNGVDRDLAAHFTILRRRGVCLYGEAIPDVFGEVPGAYYMDSIARDVADAEDAISDDPTYVALNLCRVLAYATDGAVLSKREGGQWALARVRGKYRPLIERALAAYAGEGPEKWADPAARTFAADMLRQIQKASPDSPQQRSVDP